MKRSIALKIVCLLGLMCWHLPAQAACPFTLALTSPSTAQFDMGTTSTGIFRITNSGSPSNITVLRFRVNNGDHFSGTTTAPAGWTVAFSSASGGGYNTMTYTATSGGIPSGGSVDFPIAIIFHSVSADVSSEHLRDVRATYSASCGGSTSATISNQPTWSLKSLVITLTPSSTSVSRACTGAFTLTMHVTNNSTSSLTGVISAPQPPTLNVVSGSPAPNATTASSPSISLAAGASGNTGNLAWTATVNGNTDATYFVTAFASGTNGGNTYTSQPGTSAARTLGGFILDVTPNSATALSNNQQMDWTITNHGCNPVKKVSIPIPSGWTWGQDTSNGTYSSVDIGAATPVENWTPTDNVTSVDFTAGTNLPTSRSGTFSITLSTPTTTASTSFSATVTDTNNRTLTVSDPGSITTNTFNSGSPSPNDTRRGVPWREIFQ